MNLLRIGLSCLAVGIVILAAPSVCAQEPSKLALLSKAIVKDLDGLPEADRPFVRYVALESLVQASEPKEKLKQWGSAVSLLFNSLSWNPKIVRPTPLEDSPNTYRVDLRHYKWSKKQWDLVAGTDPYAVFLNDPTSQRCREATGTERFVVRGDWLASQAASPMLYYRLLQMPNSVDELKRTLSVGEEQSLRAGFVGSQVSPFARLTERYETNFGGLWLAHTAHDRESLFEKPLARPGSSDLPTSGTTQAMFHLPNGLFAFAVWDERGQFVDLARGVQDTRAPGKPVQIAHACMSCHGQGPIAKPDMAAIRAAENASLKPDLDKIRAAYASHEKWKTLAGEDRKMATEAAKKAGADAEPASLIVALAVRYGESLSGVQVAAEVGLTAEEFDRKVRGTVFNTWGKPGTRTPRRLFADAFGELALLLKLGEVRARVNLQPPLIYPEMLHTMRGTPTEVMTPPNPMETVNLLPKGNVLPKLAMGSLQPRLQAKVERDRAALRYESFTTLANPIAISPKGDLLATQARGGLPVLLELATLKKRVELEGAEGVLQAVAFSADGNLVAAATEDRQVRVWRATSGLLLHTLEQKGQTTQIRFSPDGKWLAALGETLTFWNAKSGAPAGSPAEKEPILSFAFNADGTTFTTFGRSLKHWKTATKAPAPGPKFEADRGINKVAFSSNGKRAAFGSNAGHVTIWNLEANTAEGKIPGSGKPVRLLQFAPNGMLVTTHGTNNTPHPPGDELRIWELETRTPVMTLTGHEAAISSLVMTDRIVAAGCVGGEVRLWSIDKQPLGIQPSLEEGPFQGHYGGIRCMDVSSDGELVATGGEDSTLRIWLGSTGKQLHVFDSKKPVIAVAIAADKTSLYSCGAEGFVRQWDLASGKQTKQWQLKEVPRVAVFSPDRKTLAVSMLDRGVIFDLRIGRDLAEFSKTRASHMRLNFSSDGRLMMILDHQANVRLFDTVRAADVGSGTGWWDPKKAQFFDAGMSPNAEYLVVCTGFDQVVSVHSAKSGKKLQIVGKFPGLERNLAFAEDGKTFYLGTGSTAFDPKRKETVGIDCSLAQIDVETGRVLHYWDELPGIPQQIRPIDGGRIVYAVSRGQVMRLSPAAAKTHVRD